MKVINPKALLVVFFFIFTQSVFSQKETRISTVDFVQIGNNKKKNPTRVSGYLFIYRSVSEYDSKTKKPLLFSPQKLFFIPLKNMKSNFKETIKSFDSEKKDEIFIPINLTGNESDMSFLNTFLKNNVKVKPIKDDIHFKNNFFSKDFKTKFELKEESGIYKVVFIDGFWDARKIPFKWLASIPVNYDMSSLKSDDCTLYFLHKINTISFDIDIQDDSIDLIKNVNEG